MCFNDEITYFDRFGVNFCVGLIDLMLKDKSLIDFTNLFSSNDFKENDDIILNYFKK